MGWIDSPRPPTSTGGRTTDFGVVWGFVALAGMLRVFDFDTGTTTVGGTGLALDDNLAKADSEARCGLMVIDLKTGDIVHWLRIVGVVEELYDVVALSGVVRPMALGFKTNEIRRTISVGDDDVLYAN